MYLINSLVCTLKPFYCFIHTKTKLCVQERWNQSEINFAHLCYILCFINIVYKVKTTIRNSTSWYLCASDILIFWVRFLLSSFFFTENVSKVKITSIRFWAKEQRAENEILLVHIRSLRDLIHKIAHIGIHWDEQNIIIYQWGNRINIQRSICIISCEWRENDENYAHWRGESYLAVLFLVSKAWDGVVGCHICLETRQLGQVPWDPCT